MFSSSLSIGEHLVVLIAAQEHVDLALGALKRFLGAYPAVAEALDVRAQAALGTTGMREKISVLHVLLQKDA